MKTAKYTPVFVRIAASQVASQVSLRMFAEKKTGHPSFGLHFEVTPVKAYIRFHPSLDPETREPITVLCLSNVSVMPAAQRMGGLAQLLTELENKAYLHGCRFYIQSVAHEAVAHECDRRKYVKREQSGSGIYDYWFTGPCQMQLTPPDLFTQMETEEAFAKKPA